MPMAPPTSSSQFKLEIPRLGTTIDIIDFTIEKGVFGKGSKAKIVVKSDQGEDIQIGDLIHVYLFDTWVFSGYVRYKNDVVAITELNVAGEDNILYRRFERKIVYPEDVGKTGSMDIADVVRYIVDNYTDFSHDDGGTDTIKDTGTTITKFVINEYLANALDRLSKAIGYVWYIKQGVFYFEEPQYVGSSVELNNKNTFFEKWKVKTDRLVNELHLIGAPQEYIKSDFFRGDGTTKEFRLSYIPSGNIRVFIDGNEQPSDSYEINYDVPSIVFDTAPPYYNPSGDAIANAYPEWTWKRKITVSVDSSASPSSISDPVILLSLGSSSIDWENVNGDYSDIRFVWSDGTNVTEFPYVYLGSSGSTRYFAVKLQGKALNAGDNFELYILYGNSQASKPAWTKDDVMTLHDKFNYDGWPNSSKWTVDGAHMLCDETTCGDRVNCSSGSGFQNTIMSVNVYSSGYVKLTADVHNPGYPDTYERTTTKMVSSDLGSNYRWVYYNSQVTPSFYSGNQLTLTSVAVYSDACGIDDYPHTEVYYDGVWYFKEFDPVPTITIGDRELNANYNVEVRYAFKAPIYIKMEDADSQNNYGVYSKIIRANWITDYDMAYTLASKYLDKYKEPLREDNVRMPLKRYIDNGLYPGLKVTVNDSLHGVTGVYVIYSSKLTPGYATMVLGSETFDIFEWGAKVEERIRQLETAGDENFFTP